MLLLGNFYFNVHGTDQRDENANYFRFVSSKTTKKSFPAVSNYF